MPRFSPARLPHGLDGICIGDQRIKRQCLLAGNTVIMMRNASDTVGPIAAEGFSPRNLNYMRAFAEAWPEPEFVQEVLAQLLWYQQLALLDKLPGPQTRKWVCRAMD